MCVYIICVCVCNVSVCLCVDMFRHIYIICKSLEVTGLSLDQGPPTLTDFGRKVIISMLGRKPWIPWIPTNGESADDFPVFKSSYDFRLPSLFLLNLKRF